MNFLTDEILKGTDWRGLERAVARLMSHCGWHDVIIVGRTGDEGADIIGIRFFDNVYKTWVVQVKSITGGGYIGVSAIEEVLRAQAVYKADFCAVATNGDFTNSAKKRVRELEGSGFQVKLWNGVFLRKLLENWPDYGSSKRFSRPYQSTIIEDALKCYDGDGRKVQFVVATGLGKTMIAAELLNNLLSRGLSRFLVLCHTQDLASQLEISFWSQLPKSVPTRLFLEGNPPKVFAGVNFGLFQTLIGYLSGLNKDAFDVVIVDEAHHALAHGFRTCIEHLAPKFLIGMTATPWRGDGGSLNEMFGEPIARISLVDGMAQGYLAQVDYRMFCDNIDWDAVPNLTGKQLSIKDLNRRLFLPQRDEAAAVAIKKACEEQQSPRVAIFSPSIEHARRFAGLLTSLGISCLPVSGEDRVERQRRLMEFSAGKITAITAVDLLNEGIDVPEVNILVFMRATHSRRIFIQQLGRGLRLAPNKQKVVVLDFVSDIRRLAEVLTMDKEARIAGDKYKNIFLKDGIVEFSNTASLPFIDAWLKDITDLGDANDSEKLAFPEI